MKTIIKTSLTLLAGVALFAACDKDMEGNPTLQNPTTFTLETPKYASTVVDLTTQESLAFAWEQPSYGFDAAVDYGMQFSTSNKWTLSTDKVDNQGEVIANYANVGGTTHKRNHAVASKDLAKAIQEMTRYKENAVPASQDIYARTFAIFNGDTVFSQPVLLKVKPYYVELANAPIETWYMIGKGIGKNAWNDVIPLLPLGDQKYDTKTGKGVISWTGYLETNGFKVRKEANKWTDENFGQDGAFGTFKLNKSDIVVPAAGYYTVTLDTKKLVLTIVPYTGTVSAPYEKMSIPGGYGDKKWAPDVQSLMQAQGATAYNHDWKTTITLPTDAPSTDDGGLKFAAGSWDHNWGGNTFPYGTANNGNNIKYKKGTYTVYFNDITGQYSFVKQ